MDNTLILPVILAGGSGERLWPLSRNAYPKQFLTLLDVKHSLFQTTIQRLPLNTSFMAPLIICHEDYRFIVAEQLREINVQASGIILEPAANNTAPAIALAAQWAKNNSINPLLLVLPADHQIQDIAIFQNTIMDAVTVAQQEMLVTFGIDVTFASTGYGYIQVGAALANCSGNHVAKFIEKPDQDTANTFLNNPEYLWNSGMFMFRAQTYLHELVKYQPQIINAAQQALANMQRDLDFIRPIADFYQQCPAISIDYALMEHATNVVVFKLNTTWSDIGCWQAVWRQKAKDSNGNCISGDVVAQNSSNCLINARHRLVTTLDVHDLAIVETADAVLMPILIKAKQLNN